MGNDAIKNETVYSKVFKMKNGSEVYGAQHGEFFNNDVWMIRAETPDGMVRIVAEKVVDDCVDEILKALNGGT